MKTQNYFLENQLSIAVNGFKDIKTLVEDPDVLPADKVDMSMEGVDPPMVPLNTWILRKRALDGSNLITSIEKGPRGLQYFCTSKEKKEEIIEYIDSLEN
eukprot:6122226-Ditylum_brightwellii.AAC.1